MDRINLTDNGGFPFEQDTLDFLQKSFSRPLAALAKLCGDKTILEGVQVVGANVSAGFISYNGELILFQQCSLAAQVVIQETPTSVLFEDGVVKAEYFVRTAVCGSVGDFPFADLVPLLSLKNVWKKDDLRMCKKNAAYINANFDPVTGIGITPEEKGWQILTMQDVDAKGKVFVNRDDTDFQFSEAGYYGGEKEHGLSISEMPSHSFNMDFPSADDFLNPRVIRGLAATDNNIGTFTKSTNTLGSNVPHNNLQPYYVVLTLIKL